MWWSRRPSCNPAAWRTVVQILAWPIFFLYIFSFLCHFPCQFQKMYKQPNVPCSWGIMSIFTYWPQPAYMMLSKPHQSKMAVTHASRKIMLVGWTDRQTHIVIKVQTQGSCNTAWNSYLYISFWWWRQGLGHWSVLTTSSGSYGDPCCSTAHWWQLLGL